MELDFPYTCPEIDDEMDGFREESADIIREIIKRVAPKLDEDDRNEVINDFSERLYKVYEPRFEEVRSTNHQMRDAADSQLTHLSNDLDGARYERDEAQSELERMRYRVQELDEQLSCSQNETRRLDNELSNIRRNSW